MSPVLQKVQKLGTKTGKRSPSCSTYKSHAAKLKHPLFKMIDAGFLAVDPAISTDMYIKNRFQIDVFASYAGPVIDKILGKKPPDKDIAACWEAAVKMTKSRRSNHNTSWRRDTKCL